MAKRKLVPATLRSELTEYSSLLRALRNTQTLDIAAQLQSAFADVPGDDELDLTDEDDESISPPSTVRVEADGTTPTQVEPPGSKTPQERKRKRRKVHSTRWPLLPKDLPVPEWSLDDEVKALLTRDSSMEDASDEDINFHAQYIAAAAVSYLQSLLAVLAEHTPESAVSMSNRIQPANWESVLDVLVGADIDGAPHDEEIFDSVKRRMHELHGTLPAETSCRYRDRLGTKMNSTSQLIDGLSKYGGTEGDIFAFKAPSKRT